MKNKRLKTNYKPACLWGDYGYIDGRKKKQLIKTIIGFAVVLAIFFGGIIIVGTKNSIFSVAAVLTALPAAKLAVSYIILIKKHTPPKEQYDNILKIISKEDFLCDLIISSTEKLMNVDFLISYNQHILIMISDIKTDKKKTKDYIKNISRKVSKVNSIEAYSNFDDFYANLKKIVDCERDEKSLKLDGDIYKELQIYCIDD